MKILNTHDCNFQETPIVEGSFLRPFIYRIAKRIPNMFFTLLGRIRYQLIRRANLNPSGLSTASQQNLQPGDWVEVRSIEEIAATLDGSGKFLGLYFMPEMEQFCGKKFRIIKKAEKIKLESTGELRKLKAPSYFLEGVYCTGEHQGGCDRLCFHYWREAWLKRLPEQ